MNKMPDSITDGPNHPDEDAEYLMDIIRPITNAVECPRCKEITLSLKRIEMDGHLSLETWECCSCGHEEVWV